MTMFLKIMHGGVDEFMAEVGEPQASYDLYADVVSCHFRRYSEPCATDKGAHAVWGQAHIWVREPIKTAEVPGHCEVEKYVDLTGDAFLMNEQGRTISKFLQARVAPLCEFSAQTGTQANKPAPISGQTEPDDRARTARLLKELPYWSAALIRRSCRIAGNHTILSIMDSEQIAVDA